MVRLEVVTEHPNHFSKWKRQWNVKFQLMKWILHKIISMSYASTFNFSVICARYLPHVAGDVIWPVWPLNIFGASHLPSNTARSTCTHSCVCTVSPYSVFVCHSLKQWPLSSAKLESTRSTSHPSTKADTMNLKLWWLKSRFTSCGI